MLIQEQLDYTVQLPVFEGPLDLLLRLIEREELDITTVALAQVADAYLGHVRAMDAPNPGALSAFLVIAAKLLAIKSRALLPRPAARGPDDAPDEGEQLAQQLREYQRYKQAAALLRAWDEQGRRAYVRAAAPPTMPQPRQSIPFDATLGDMLAAVQRRMQLRLPGLDEQPEAALPAPKIISVPEMAERIRERLRAMTWFSFEDLLSLTAQRVEVIVALWAVLELLKRRAIVVEQERLFGPVMIGRGPNLDSAALHELAVEEHMANAAEG